MTSGSHWTRCVPGERNPGASLVRSRIRSELSNHCEPIEQQSADRIGEVVHRFAEVQTDLTRGELVGDCERKWP